MKKTNLLFIFLWLFNWSCIAQVSSKKATGLSEALKGLINDPTMKTASIGFFAIDTDSGEPLYAYDPDRSMQPASTLKLVTTAAALEILSPDFRFETTLGYTGKIDTLTHILKGNLVIKGGGDPSLGSRFFPEKEKFLADWVNAVGKKNIQLIDGKIIGDARIFGKEIVPPTWAWEDMGNYFGAGACGLTIFDNMYTLTFRTGKTVGAKTEIIDISPNIPGLTIDNNVKSGRVYSDRSYIFGAPYHYHRYINGLLPLNKSAYKVKGSMPDPAYFAAYILREELQKQKITGGLPTTFRQSPELERKEKNELHILHKHLSPKLIEIIRQTNFRSINLFAEHLFSYIRLKAVNFNTKIVNKNFMENFWRKKGIDTQGMSLYDGSGLSHYNTITARQLVNILKYMKNKSRYSDAFYKSIATVGKEGTVRNICKGTKAVNNMHAKSGSIKGVRAYAGYVRTQSGRKVAFALLINDFSGSSSAARKKMEKVMSALANYTL